MANKYIRHGETYCGDGTTSAAATSNGGVGAWNNINVFEGTAPAYGTLAAGDVVYIRSKDAAGNPIVRTMTANKSIGSAVAINANIVTWIIDNGATWAGVDAVISYPNSGGNYTLTFVDFNHIIALRKDGLTTVTANAWGSAWAAMDFGQGVYTRNIKVDASSWTQDKVRVGLGGATLENFSINIGILGSSDVIFLGLPYTSSNNTIINPEIVINGASTGQGIAAGSAYAGTCQITFVGGAISGAAADAGAVLVGDCLSPVRFIGTLIPRTMRTSVGPSYPVHHAEAIGCDGDGTGGYLDAYWGWATSRTDNYPPTLSATLPSSDSAPWAWRVYPRNASWNAPMNMVYAKLFTESPSTKTITLELLIATTFSVTKNNVWIDVCYLDATTGLGKHLNSRDFTSPNLEASTAGWTATTWGMTNFNKQKLSVVTPTTIKQNTLIAVTVFCTKKASTVDDILFIDPDFGVN